MKGEKSEAQRDSETCPRSPRKKGRRSRLDSLVNTGMSANVHLSFIPAGRAVSTDSSPTPGSGQALPIRRDTPAGAHRLQTPMERAPCSRNPQLYHNPVRPAETSLCLDRDHWVPHCSSKCRVTSTVPATEPVGPHVAGRATAVPSGSPLAGLCGAPRPTRPSPG